MRVVRREEAVKLRKEALRIVYKLLNKIPEITKISDNKDGAYGAGVDFAVEYTREGQLKKKTIQVMAENPKAKEMFVGTYTTKYNGSEIDIVKGKAFSSHADFIFFLKDDILFSLPRKKFVRWVDENCEIMRSECLKTWNNGKEAHLHGFLVPLDRIRMNFSKGNLAMKIYRIMDNPNDDVEIDYEEEL